MPTRVIPCTDCGEWQRDIEQAGGTFVSCDPIAGRPGFCQFVFNYGTTAAGIAKTSFAAPKQLRGVTAKRAKARTSVKRTKARVTTKSKRR